MSDRIVISGAGVITSIGAGVEAFGEALFEGRTGLAESAVVDLGDGHPAVTCEVRDFTPQQWLGPKGIRALDRSARLLAVAAHMALSSVHRLAGEEEEGDPELGLVCGTVFGSVHSIASFDWSGLKEGPKFVNPMAFPNTVINSPAGQAAIKFKLRGVNSTISAGLASSLVAIQYAADFLRFGRASMLLAGGVEEIAEESYLGFKKNGWLSSRSTPLPFSEDRDGVVLGEGSALVVLERESSSRQAGRSALAEVAGFGSAQDAYGISRFAPSSDGAVRAIREALATAGVAPGNIGCIISGASGSRAGDLMEYYALRQAFGASLNSIPVCCPKAAFGEALGASGALLAVAGLLALQRALVPPTPGFSNLPAELSVSDSVRPLSGDYVLVTGFSCEGSNAALVLKRAA